MFSFNILFNALRQHGFVGPHRIQGCASVMPGLGIVLCAPSSPPRRGRLLGPLHAPPPAPRAWSPAHHVRPVPTRPSIVSPTRVTTHASGLVSLCPCSLRVMLLRSVHAVPHGGVSSWLVVFRGVTMGRGFLSRNAPWGMLALSSCLGHVSSAMASVHRRTYLFSRDCWAL